METSFPASTPYNGDEGVRCLSGTAYQTVDDLVARRAFRGASCMRSRGPDGIGPLAIRCVYDWEPDRIVALIRARVRLGIHPRQWKTARGVTTPKPERMITA